MDDATLKRCAAVIADLRVLQTSTMTLWNDEISMMLPGAQEEDEDGASAEGTSLWSPPVDSSNSSS